MEGFNKHQGASNRDMEGNKGEVVATEAAVVEGVGDAHKMRTQAPGGIPQYVPQMGGPQQNYMPGFNNSGIVLAIAERQATSRGGRQNQNLKYSNQYKIFNNWNVCYSHGFDVEDGHNSAMCGIRKMNHQEGFTCKNAQAYIDAGYAPSTQGMHQNISPTNF
jgi:hypothetical protein